MKARRAGAVALAIATLVGGCTVVPPEIPPVEQIAERALVVGEPFAYHTEGEALDVTDSESSTSLELDGAVRLALRHNAQIQASLARLRQAEADARQTRLLPNPVLGIAFRLPAGGGRSVIDADLSAELLSLITRPGRISAVESRLRKASADTLRIVLDVAVEVQRQYADVQALDARVQIVEARRSILQELANLTNSRLRAGEAARLDVLTAQSELSSVDSELIALRSEQRLSRIALACLIGQPSARADWSLPAWTLPPMPSLADEAWIHIALENRPELSAIKWELAALGQEVRLARTEALLSGGNAGLAAERDDVWSIGPAVSIPLPVFDTGAVAKQRRQDQIVEQRHELTQGGREIIEEVRRALEMLRSAQVGLERVRAELLPLQEQRLQQARDSYRAGVTDMLALRLAEQDLQQARGRVIDLQQQVAKARFELDRAVGGSGSYLNTAGTTRPTTTPTE